MMIEVSTSGGIAGLGAAKPVKRVDTAEVGVAMREDYCTYFDPEALNRLSTAAPDSGAADMLNYHITVTEPSGARHEYDLREDQLPPEMLDLIDGM